MSLWRNKKKWGLMLAGALAMLIVIAAGYQGVRHTSTTEFCLSCHSMKTVGVEYQQSIHFKNASGVRAECVDCHISPGIIPTLIRKAQALSELYHEYVSPTIDTPEKFEQRRETLAKREWDRMTSNGSAACKSCHSYNAMDHAKQSPQASEQMTKAALDNGNCISCHKGIAHHLPDMSGNFRKIFSQLEQQAAKPPEQSELYTLIEKPITATQSGKAGSAKLMPASQVKVLSSDQDQLQIEITGWREVQGRGRVITQYPGKRIFTAVLDDTLQQNVKVLQQQTDPVSHQDWQQISITVWTSGSGFTNSLEPVWQNASDMLQATCSSCHSAPPTSRYNANGWIAGLKAMSTYYRLEKQEEFRLLKYLQTHASDIPNQPN
ncbi:pentaheme c-type cytochrome TorC [Budvicia diplopodorum]|uniref:pentaheme c-type cytochrome TorC n=1 Tax=Budvicia diplopodorum TaxID=1119056 RepID=UPI001356AC20|nr:pentaheme c-type cytochrome TorC [Budvicia diplopodorum]